MSVRYRYPVFLLLIFSLYACSEGAKDPSVSAKDSAKDALGGKEKKDERKFSEKASRDKKGILSQKEKEADHKGRKEKGQEQEEEAEKNRKTVLKGKGTSAEKPANTRGMGGYSPDAPMPGSPSFRRKFGPKEQTFMISQKEGGVVECENGTRLRFPPKAFVLKNGDTVNGPIQVEVKEYYEEKDMLLADLGTRSKGRVLETGGMIKVEAESEGKECELREGKEMKVRFPERSIKNGMKLFNGDREEDGRMEWRLSSTEEKKSEESKASRIHVGSEVDERPDFPGGRGNLKAFILEYCEFPESARGRGLQGEVVSTVILDEEGQVEKVSVDENVDKALARSAKKALKKMPPWSPALKEGKKVRYKFPIPIQFSQGKSKGSEGAYLSSSYSSMQMDAKKAKNRATYEAKKAFASEELGWINCDRFQNVDEEVKEVVRIEDRPYVTVKMVFQERRSILEGRSEEDRHVFQKVPEGERVKFVAIGYRDGSYLLDIEDHWIGGETPEFQFQELDEKGLEKRLAVLDRGS